MLQRRLMNAAASPGKVQQLVVQDNQDSVHESQTTELENSLEPGDWKVSLVIHLKDPSQTRDRKIR
jgi:hypothetical protein